MATTKTIQTRIKNRFDTLANWKGQGVELLPGEIALVSVTTQQIDQATGDVINVPAVLMKVGESDGNGGTKAFNELPWVSALAADVYDWAKEADPSTITVKYRNGGTDNAPTFASATLSDVLKDLETAKADIAAFKSNVLDSISIDPATATENGVVQGVTYDNKTGKFTVSYGLVETKDISDDAVTGSKIADNAVTNDKIANEAVTNDKVATISSDKITIGTGTADGSLSKKLSTMDAEIAGKADAHDHTTYENQHAFSNIKVGTTTVAADTITDTVEFVGENVTITPDATNDKITFKVEKGTASTEGVVKLGSTGGAATYDSIYGSDGKGGINAQVVANTANIANLQDVVTGGVHFLGTVSEKPDTAAVKVNGSETADIATKGDIVIWPSKSLEYIYTGSSWEELGDPSGLAARIDALDYDGGGFGASKFVTKVVQADGKITATYEQPTSTDIIHSKEGSTNKTVKAELDSINAELADKANSDDVYTIEQTKQAINQAKTDAATDASNKIVVALSEAETYANGLNTAMNTRVAGLEEAKEDYDAEFANIHDNYVRCTQVTGTDKYQMHLGESTEVIIFDCGGAPTI